MFINKSWLLSIILSSIDAAQVFMEDETLDACKCACFEDGDVICASIGREDCHALCRDRCKLKIHTVDEDGGCDIPKNCTCIDVEKPKRPICGRSRVTNVDITFRNYREMQCHNICHNYEYYVLFTARCLPDRDSSGYESGEKRESVGDRSIQYTEGKTTKPVWEKKDDSGKNGTTSAKL